MSREVLVPGRLKIYASAAFFITYLVAQLTLPAVVQFTSGFSTFGWRMYASGARASYLIVFEDGSSRELPRVFSRASPVRAYSASASDSRFLIPHLCGRWKGVREIYVRRLHRPEQVIQCRSIAR